MKRPLLILKPLLLLCALVVGSSYAWATTVTKTVSELQSANKWTVSSGNTIGTLATSFSLDANITISTSGSANCGSVWGSDTKDWRLYQNKSGDVTVTASNGYVITSIIFTYTVGNTGTLKDGSTAVASGTEQTFTAQSNTTTKTYTVGNTGKATNGQVKITQFSVTYEASSGGGSTPSITAANVEIASNATSGSIAYTLDNGTGNVSAALTTGLLTRS